MKQNKRSGFTLIEMLVVVAIVGLLSSVVVVGVGGARQKARDAKRVADVRQIQTWFESNYNNATGYPNVTTYPAELPKDPTGGTYPAYSVCSNAQVYAIGVTFENAGNRPSGGVAAAQLPCSLSVTCANAPTDRVYCVTSNTSFPVNARGD